MATTAKKPTVGEFRAVNVPVVSQFFFDKTNTPIPATGSFSVPNECTVMFTDAVTGETREKHLRYYNGCPTIDKDIQIQKYGAKETRQFEAIDRIWFDRHYLATVKENEPMKYQYLIEAQPTFTSLYSKIDQAAKEQSDLEKIEELQTVYNMITKLGGNSELLRKAADQFGIDPNKSDAGIILAIRKKAEVQDNVGNPIGIQRVRGVLESFKDMASSIVEQALDKGIIQEEEFGYSYATGEKLKHFRAKEPNVKKNRTRLAEWFRTEEGLLQSDLIEKQISSQRAAELVTE